MLQQLFPILNVVGILIMATPLPASPGLRQVLDPAETGKGDTVLWTALTARSWQALGTLAGLKQIDLRQTGVGKQAHPIGEVLNGTAHQLGNVFPASTRTWSGELTPVFLQQINQELAALFPGQARQVAAPANPVPNSLIAVTALNHRVEFARPFYRAQGRTMRFVTSKGEVIPVAFFGSQGFYNEGFSVAHLRVHAYQSAGDFVIELPARTEGENIWIVRMPGRPSLADHFDAVKKAIAAPSPADPTLTSLDVLRIPCIDFTSTADLTEQLGGTFTGSNGADYRIAGCHQWIDFKLDETGARIKARAEIRADPFGSLPPPPPPVRPKPRQFICDGPFTVLLWRKDSQLPYAAFQLDGGKWN